MTVDTNIGKITASKEVLNKLSIVLSDSATYLSDRHFYARSQESQTAADEIFKALGDVGYYNH